MLRDPIQRSPMQWAGQETAPRLASHVDPKLVRLSLTDRCDLACVYCRPHRHDGYTDDKLSLSEWAIVLAGLRDAGIERVRITGGEPLLSASIVPFVRLVSGFGFKDIALTTNATQLAELAKELRDAGLHRLTVSLDTLLPDRFARLTRGGDLGPVLRGIDRALEVGFRDTKLNTVVVRGENDTELEDIVRFAWARSITPRFLEIMKIGEGASLQHQLVTMREIRERLSPLLGKDTPLRDAERGPARYVHAAPHHKSPEGFVARVGFISGTSDTYCLDCDRLRVSSDGMVRPCLAKNEGVMIARSGSLDAALVVETIREAWKHKPDGTTFKGCTEESASEVSIRAIGG
ncbi:MAG: radical SAM protein [Polyangiaceae bacterium]|nr:radical SAM protein [Polyangiaceae bacterium]